MPALVRAKHNKLASLPVPHFLTAALTSRWFWTADRDYLITRISWDFGTNASVADTLTAVKRSSPGVAIADGTALMTAATFNTSAVDTTHNATLITAPGVLKLKPGDALGFLVPSALTSLAGGHIQFYLEAI